MPYSPCCKEPLEEVGILWVCTDCGESYEIDELPEPLEDDEEEHDR